MRKETIQHSQVRVAVNVSFQVGRMDYGTVHIPVGTSVFRKIVDGKISDWWVADPAPFCPDAFKHNGKVDPDGMFMHDATYYGISVPDANVQDGKGVYAVAAHKSFHY